MPLTMMQSSSASGNCRGISALAILVLTSTTASLCTFISAGVGLCVPSYTLCSRMFGVGVKANQIFEELVSLLPDGEKRSALQAAAERGLSTVRYAYVQWGNGGARSHTQCRTLGCWTSHRRKVRAHAVSLLASMYTCALWPFFL